MYTFKIKLIKEYDEFYMGNEIQYIIRIKPGHDHQEYLFTSEGRNT